MGLNDDPDRFGLFLVIILLESLAAIGLGLVVSTIAPTVEAANALGPPIVIVFLLFGGFYINIDSLPTGSRWVTYVSLLKWAFEALAINEFEGETFTCKSSDLTCQPTGKAVLDNLSFGNSTVGEALLGLFVVFICYNILAYIILRIGRTRYQTLGYVGRRYALLDAKVKAASAAADDTNIAIDAPHDGEPTVQAA